MSERWHGYDQPVEVPTGFGDWVSYNDGCWDSDGIEHYENIDECEREAMLAN